MDSKKQKMVKIKNRICKRCGKEFHPTAMGQKYCGKQKEKGTCSYLHNLEQMRKNRLVPEKKELAKKRSKEWWSEFKKTERYKEYLDNRKVQYLKFRFQILKRDGFTCQYCGRKAPSVELQIDHIYPRAKGGKKKMDNLITACSECNIGKTDLLL